MGEILARIKQTPTWDSDSARGRGRTISGLVGLAVFKEWLKLPLGVGVCDVGSFTGFELDGDPDAGAGAGAPSEV